MRAVTLVVGSIVLTVAQQTAAQGLQNGDRIETRDYSVDLSQGPVLASSRIIGLAGAYVAIAEGVDSLAQNPAAPAVRLPWSFDHFDYDLSFGATFPSSITKSDFFFSGSERTQLTNVRSGEFVFLNLGAGIQFGATGIGLTLEAQQYGLHTPQPGEDDDLRAQIIVAHLDIAHAFFDGQAVVGAGFRSTGLDVINQAKQDESERNLFSTTGAAPEVGILVRPNNQRFRAGIAFSAAVTAQTVTQGNADEPLYAGTDPLFPPNRVSLPWQLNAGIAVQLGPRPFNPRWVDPSSRLEKVRAEIERRSHAREKRRRYALEKVRQRGADSAAAEAAVDADSQLEAALDRARLERAERQVDASLRARYRAFSRRYVLISTAVLVSGPSSDAVGVESFLSRIVNRSGLATTVSPRIGVETEVWPNHLKLRVGSYVEPTRFRSNRERYRVHGTLGAELNVLSWSIFGLFADDTEWRFGAVGDASTRYFSFGLSIGVWH